MASFILIMIIGATGSFVSLDAGRACQGDQSATLAPYAAEICPVKYEYDFND